MPGESRSRLLWRYNVAFGLIIITCIFIFAFASNYLLLLANDLYEVSDVHIPSLRALSAMEKGMMEVTIAEQSLVIANVISSDYSGHLTDIDDAFQRIDQARREYDSFYKSSRERALWEEFTHIYNDWEMTQREVLYLISELNSREEIAALQSDLLESITVKSLEAKAAHLEAKTMLESLVSASNEHAKNQVVQVDKALVRSIHYAIAVSGFGAIFVTVIAIYITRMINLFVHESQVASEAKSRFLANMSHEIRTPLNLMLGMADLLGNTELNSDQKEYVRILNNSGENLYCLVNNVLDLSKIESGSFTLTQMNFDLYSLVDDTVELFQATAQKKGLTLQSGVDPKIPALLRGDSGRLRQILINLIGNAIKYTDQGEIALEVDSTRISHDKVKLLFSVRDTGIGIPEDKLSNIFNSFTQVNMSTSRKHEGTGLGLAIARSFAEIMGGRLWVESRLGAGSVFYFEVVLTVVSPRQEAATVDEECLVNDQKVRILLVEDNVDNQLLIQRFLANPRYVLDIANNGQEAVEKVQSDNYDLVLMDIQMPVMDGYGATASIREWEKKSGKRPVKIIALTAYNLKNEIEKMFSLGFDSHVSKPIKKAQLLNIVDSYEPQ